MKTAEEIALAELDSLLEHSIERGGGEELTQESYYEAYQKKRQDVRMPFE